MKLGYLIDCWTFFPYSKHSAIHTDSEINRFQRLPLPNVKIFCHTATNPANCSGGNIIAILVDLPTKCF